MDIYEHCVGKLVLQSELDFQSNEFLLFHISLTEINIKVKFLKITVYCIIFPHFSRLKPKDTLCYS